MSIKLCLRRWTRRFTGDARGVSAVEFALILPLMMTLYLGGTEVSQAISASRKVTLVSRTVADLASRFSGITATEMTNILNASAAVVSPFPSNKLKVTVTQIKIDANKTMTIDWTESYNGGTGSGTTITVPDALKIANTWLIWTQAEYDYVPTLGYALTGEMKLKDQMYMRPRLSESVTYPSP